jgi:hypothetical protein
MLLSAAALVGSYATASYEGLVASLWVGGLYAGWHDLPVLACACAASIMLLRHTSFWQGYVLLIVANTWWSLPVIVTVGTVLFRQYPDAMRSVFGEGTPPPYYPRDGWRKGLRVLTQRYEVFAGWLALALVIHAWTPTCAMLLGVTGVTLVVQHGQRTLWRPKWVVGYLPDFALPVVLILAVAIAPALAQLEWWPYVLLWLGWGLVRRRHPALP